LMFIAPVLAGVTAARGSFSIDLDKCRIPLSDPAAGEMTGRFTVHSVEVGPGPLVQELAILLGRASPATLRRESTVQFRMVEGWMYHEGLDLVFPDLTVRTHGWVGLRAPHPLNLTAVMPVPPKWIGNNPLGTALRNQTIQIPIGGTITQPKLDRRTLQHHNRQILQRAAGNLLEDQLRKHLLPPGR